MLMVGRVLVVSISALEPKSVGCGAPGKAICFCMLDLGYVYAGSCRIPEQTARVCVSVSVYSHSRGTMEIYKTECEVHS